MTPTVINTSHGITADTTVVDLIAKATGLRSALRERQTETEALGYYPQSTHLDLRDSGLYRVLQPRRFDGYELDLATFLKVVVELARGCPSTAWSFGFGVSHQLIANGLFPQDVQAELQAGDVCLLSATAAISPIPAAKSIDGYRIQGTYKYGSGSPHSTHYLGGGVDELGKPITFVVPRSGYTLRDDWKDSLGLRGSGSNTIDIDTIIPESYVLQAPLFMPDIQGGSIGSRLHGNAMFSVPLFPLTCAVMASVGVGAGWAAIDEYKQVLFSKKAFKFGEEAPLMKDTEEFQTYLGLALASMHSAEAIVTRVAQLTMSYSVENVRQGAWSPEWDQQLVSMSIEALHQVWRAVQENIVTTIGTTSVARPEERLQRYLRDLQMLMSHRFMGQRFPNAIAAAKSNMLSEAIM